MIEIRIITTAGCEGCRIMKNIADKAVKQLTSDSNLNIKVTTFDCLDESIRHFVNRYQVKDYPATFIIKNNEVKDRIYGTTSKNSMIEHIVSLLLEDV